MPTWGGVPSCHEADFGATRWPFAGDGEGRAVESSALCLACIRHMLDLPVTYDVSGEPQYERIDSASPEVNALKVSMKTTRAKLVETFELSKVEERAMYHTGGSEGQRDKPALAPGVPQATPESDVR